MDVCGPLHYTKSAERGLPVSMMGRRRWISRCHASLTEICSDERVVLGPAHTTGVVVPGANFYEFKE